MVNSLECGGPAPLWSAATSRRVESTQAGVVVTGRDWPKRCQASALQRVLSLTLDQSLLKFIGHFQLNWPTTKFSVEKRFGMSFG